MAHSDVILGNSPLAYYRLDETSGTTFSDSAGSADGTHVNTPSLAQTGLLEGDSNTAVRYDDDTSEYGYISGSDINPTSAITVECLVKFNEAPDPSDNPSVIDKWDFPGGNRCWALGTSSGSLVANVSYDGSFTNRLEVVGSAPTLDQTYHLVMTYDGQTLKFYVDGVLIGSDAYGSPETIFSSTGTDVWFARTRGTGNRYADIVLDEVAIYTTALTDAQVRKHYYSAQGYDGYPLEILKDAPISYYRLGEPSGTTATDETGNNDGTYNGTPTLGASSLLSEDPSDTAVGFDGTDDYVEIDGVAGDLSDSDAFTLELWFMTSATPATDSEEILFSAHDSSDGDEFRVGIGNSGGIFLATDPDSGEENGSGYNDGNPHCLHVTISDSGTTNVYVDDMEVTGFNDTDPSWTDAVYASIGQEYDASHTASDFFTGTIDEVAIYDSVLDATQRAEHFSAGGGGITEVLTETMTVAEAVVGAALYAAILSEDIDIVSSYAVGVGRSVIEALILDDALGIIGHIDEDMSVAESVEFLVKIASTILEDIELSDTSVSNAVSKIVESLMIGESIPDNVSAGRVIVDGLSVGDALRVAYTALVSDNTAFSDTDSSYVQKAALIAEGLLLSGAVQNYHRAVGVVADAVVLQAIAERYFQAVALDDVSISGAVVALHRAVTKTIEDAHFSDTVADNLRLFAVVEDGMLGSDGLTVAARLVGMIEDGFEFTGVLTLPDGQYTAWVVNTESLGISEYSNYPFNSFARLGNTYLGATELGIYALEGDDDAGTSIDSVIRTGLLDFGKGVKKRIPSAYLGYTADGRLILKLSVTDSGDKKEYWYELDQSRNAPVVERIKSGKGLKSVYWQFEIINADGIDFELDMVKLYTVLLDRRV